MKKNKLIFVITFLFSLPIALGAQATLPAELSIEEMKTVTSAAVEEYLPDFYSKIKTDPVRSSYGLIIAREKFFPSIPVVTLPEEWKVGENVILEDMNVGLTNPKAPLTDAFLFTEGESFRWKTSNNFSFSDPMVPSITLLPEQVCIVGKIEGKRACVFPNSVDYIKVAPVHGLTMDHQLNKILVEEGSVLLDGAWQKSAPLYIDNGLRGRTVYFANNVMVEDFRAAVRKLLEDYRIYDQCKLKLHAYFNSTNLLDLANNKQAAQMFTAYEEYVSLLREHQTQKLTPRNPSSPSLEVISQRIRAWRRPATVLFPNSPKMQKALETYKKYKGITKNMLLSALVVGGMELLNNVLTEMEGSAVSNNEARAVELSRSMWLREKIMDNIAFEPSLGLLLPEAEQRYILDKKDETSKRFGSFLIDYVSFALATQKKGTLENEIYHKIQAQELSQRVYEKEIS